MSRCWFCTHSAAQWMNNHKSETLFDLIILHPLLKPLTRKKTQTIIEVLDNAQANGSLSLSLSFSSSRLSLSLFLVLSLSHSLSLSTFFSLSNFVYIHNYICKKHVYMDKHVVEWFMGKLLNLNHRPITIITGQSVQRLHKHMATSKAPRMPRPRDFWVNAIASMSKMVRKKSTLNRWA